jgi:hypothetical protein
MTRIVIGRSPLAWLFIALGLVSFSFILFAHFPTLLTSHVFPNGNINSDNDRDASRLWKRAVQVPSLSTSIPRIPHSPLPSSGNGTAEPLNLQSATNMLDEALDEIEARNRARMNHPRRNQYRVKYPPGEASKPETGPEEPPSLFPVSDELAAAAAMVAEADARARMGTAANATSLETRETAAEAFWMQGLKRQGSWPWGGNAPDFKVFRNVKDYGAVGDGLKVSVPGVLGFVTDHED